MLDSFEYFLHDQLCTLSCRSGSVPVVANQQDWINNNKEIKMSDYIEDLLDVGFDDYEDDCDDAVEM